MERQVYLFQGTGIPLVVPGMDVFISGMLGSARYQTFLVYWEEIMGLKYKFCGVSLVLQF